MFTSSTEEETHNLPLPLEIRQIIWDFLLPSTTNTIFTPGTPSANILHPLSLNLTIRAEYLPLVLNRLTIDISNPHPRHPVPQCLHHAQHLLIAASVPTWTSLPSPALFFPHLRTATLPWPTPPDAHGTTLAGLLGSNIAGEARRYGISALFRLRWLSNPEWVLNTEKLERAVSMRQGLWTPPEVRAPGVLQAKVRVILAADATVTVVVPVVTEGLRRGGQLSVNGGEAEQVEMVGPLKLWGFLCKGPAKLREMGGTEEMKLLCHDLLRLENKQSPEFRGHLRYAMNRGLAGWLR